MKSPVAGLMYDVVRQRHLAWERIRGLYFNNTIIDMLRNRLADDAHEWFQVHIKKRHVYVPEEF